MKWDTKVRKSIPREKLPATALDKFRMCRLALQLHSIIEQDKARSENVEEREGGGEGRKGRKARQGKETNRGATLQSKPS